MITVEEALKEALEPPDHYFGAITDLVTQGWAQVASRHRDSDTLDISNWETMLTFYNEKYEVNEDFRVEGSSHWAVGWCDTLLVRALECSCEDWEDADFVHEEGAVVKALFDVDTVWRCRTCNSKTATPRQVFLDALDFAERLQNYPVLDEEDYSRREHEEFMEWLESELPYACRQIDEDLDYSTVNIDKVAEYLFDVHSVCSTEDIGDISWVVDAVRKVSDERANTD